MKKNGFTLVELIAVLVILSIIGMLAAPNVVNLMQSGKQKSFISDAEEMVSTATYMYKSLIARDSSIGTTEYKIEMYKLNGNVPENDPYGFKYDQNNSYISFTEPSEYIANGKRTIKVHIKSCKDSKCHCIDSSDGSDLKTSDIKDNC